MSGGILAIRDAASDMALALELSLGEGRDPVDLVKVAIRTFDDIVREVDMIEEDG